jgi:hypothetical protein
VTVWLWQADGPASGGRGVSGDRLAARRAAEVRLLRGDAAEAVVEEAVTDLSPQTLAEGYRRTGPRWVAAAGPGPHVRWVPAQDPQRNAPPPRDLKWTAVAAVISEQIAGMKPGDRVSIGELGPELRVGRKTAARALAELAAGGFLGREAGVGYVVLRQPEPG